MKLSCLSLPIDLGILGEQSVEVKFHYFSSFPGSREDPPEPEHIEINDVCLAQPADAAPWPRVSLLPWLEPDTLDNLEQQVLERFNELAENAATDAAIDRWEEKQLHNTQEF
jgi:hypothetical protein